MSSLLEYVLRLPSDFQGDVAVRLFEDYFDILFYFEVLYIILVFCVPPLMKNRAPFNLRIPFIIWNALLSAFSLLGAINCVTVLAYLLRDRGFHLTTCTFDSHVLYDGKYGFWLFAFLVSKIPEMLDTAFLIFQKKPVIFLHWYHHLTVTLFCWYAGYTLIPSGIWYATMNYMVHSIMYFYYFLCALGLRPYVRPIAPFITAAQLGQMVLGTGIVLYTYYYSYFSPLGCDVDRRTIRMGVCMYGSYFALFAVLFVRLYISKAPRPMEAKRKVSNGTAVKSLDVKDNVQ